MKKIIIALNILAGTLSFSGFRNYSPTGINGSIDPPNGARKIVAVSGKDSAFATPVDGMFFVETKPGSWTLIVIAAPPYKNAAMGNVRVTAGRSTDVGTIKLPH